jgi:hypothetical protein
MLTKLLVVFITMGVLGIISAHAGQQSPTADRGPSVETGTRRDFFEFHSGFWINLHHFLYLQAVLAAPEARKDGALAVQRALPDLKMTADQRTAWNRALVYYRQFGNSDALRDRTLITANYELSDAASSDALGPRRLPPEMISALEAAAPVYRTLWWTQQDRLNRHWIALASELVNRYGEALSRRIASIYRKQWPAEKIPVEVVSYANWAGAYTTRNSTLITVSSSDPSSQSDAALEILFHEASHALIDDVQEAISRRCKTEGITLDPPTLWHAVLFYTTGALTKELIPGYVPVADAIGLWKRAWPIYIGALKKDWQPYLDGKSSLDSAVAALVRDTAPLKR